MAEALVKNIEKNLACSVCFEQLNDPIGLPCLHAYCFVCLQNWYKASGSEGQVLCPACKKPAQVPEDGIRGFPGHFLVKNLKETVDKEKMLQKAKSSHIVVGAIVKIKAPVEAEKSLDSISCLQTGKVTSIDEDQVTVDFPEREGWLGLISEIEPVLYADNDAACDLCDNPAETHCLDCKQYHCQQCQKHHDAFKSMSEHEIVTASDVISGKVSNVGRHCEAHGELVRYYCWNEKKQVCHDCVSLKICSIQHDRVTLAKAARMQSATLKQMVSQCDDIQQKYHEALAEMSEMHSNMNDQFKKAQDDMEMLKEQVNDRLEKLWSSKDLKLAKTHGLKEGGIMIEKRKLVDQLNKIEETCASAIEIAEEGSDQKVTFNYVRLSGELKDIAKSPNPTVNSNRWWNNLEFDVGKLQDYLKLAASANTANNSTSWKKSHEFDTSENIGRLQTIAISPEGKITLTSYGDQAAVFTSDQRFSHILKNAPKSVHDVAVTSDERYIICGKNKLLCYDDKGKSLSTIATTSIHGKPSPPVTVAVDRHGRIVAGLEDGTVSIYYADGTQVSQFQDHRVYYISTTVKKSLVISHRQSLFASLLLQVINYSGNLLRCLGPPLKVSTWSPGRTCCNDDDEIFVINEDDLYHHSIHRFSYDGKYQGLVTSDVECPRGMAFSYDEDELYVTDGCSKVKIFKKQ